MLTIKMLAKATAIFVLIAIPFGFASISFPLNWKEFSLRIRLSMRISLRYPSGIGCLL